MNCHDTQKKIKSSSLLTEEEKKHVSGCSQCQEVLDKVLEKDLEDAGGIIRHRTAGVLSSLETSGIMNNIKVSLGKKIEFFNPKLFAFITLIVIVFVFSSYYSFKSGRIDETSTVNGSSEQIVLKDRNDDVEISEYYDEIKGQKGYMIKTGKEGRCVIRGGYDLFISNDSELTCVFSSVDIKKGKIRLEISDISHFIRVNCDNLFFFNSKDCNINLTRDDEKAILDVESGLLELHIKDRFVLVSEGERIVVYNNRRMIRKNYDR